MNNEPVAFVTGAKEFQRVDVHTVLKVGTPLYTHPVKQITDGEILNIILKYESESGDNTTYDVLSCIREILRKAQER